MNYGLKLKRAKRHHWVMGSGKATRKLGADAGEINPEGDWTKYTNSKEPQRRNGLETMACTNFAFNKAITALAKLKKYSLFPKNPSDRYTAIGTGTTPQGNDPWQVISKIATELGAIPEDDLPFSDDINTWDEYYSPPKSSADYRALVRKGELVLRGLEIEPEWVIKPFTHYLPEEKHQRLKQAIKRGPIAVSVYAWDEEGGEYVKTGDDNHLVFLLRYDGHNPVISDQYPPFEKTLAPYYDFGSAIIVFMRENRTGILPKDRPLAIRIIKQLITLLQELSKNIGSWLGFTRS